MRLTQQQRELILQSVHSRLGPETRTILFGSQLDDQRHGGDIDLLLEPPTMPPLLQRAQLKLALESALGRPVDLVIHPLDRPATPFQQLARLQGVELQ